MWFFMIYFFPPEKKKQPHPLPSCVTTHSIHDVFSKLKCFDLRKIVPRNGHTLESNNIYKLCDIGIESTTVSFHGHASPKWRRSYCGITYWQKWFNPSHNAYTINYTASEIDFVLKRDFIALRLILPTQNITNVGGVVWATGLVVKSNTRWFQTCTSSLVYATFLWRWRIYLNVLKPEINCILCMI